MSSALLHSPTQRKATDELCMTIPELPPIPPKVAPPPAVVQVPPRGGWSKFLAILVLLLSGLYLINPTLGVFELLPDNLPLVGNLDEAFFTLAFVSALASLGLRIPFLHKP